MTTDAQVHLFDADTPARPWPRDGRDDPVTKLPSFGAEHMLGAMKAIGVDWALIVPPVWAGDHNETALRISADYPDRFAVMGWLDPFEADAQSRVETWLEQPGMLGIRISSRFGPHLALFRKMAEDPDLAWFWQACERLSIPIMCLTRDAIGLLEPIAASQPKLRLVIDHLGTAGGTSLEDAFRNLETMLELARFENVHVRVSMAPNYSQQAYLFEDVAPLLRRVYDAYGARRLMWAADMTQLSNNTYAERLRLRQEGLPFPSGEDRDWILGRTLAEALPWPEHDS